MLLSYFFKVWGMALRMYGHKYEQSRDNLIFFISMGYPIFSGIGLRACAFGSYHRNNNGMFIIIPSDMPHWYDPV